MPSKSMPVREAREIAQRIAAEMNVELVDAELVKEPTGHFLRFYIEKPDGIALNDLEAFHRRILPLMERVEYDYMEVSSPGADRPLKTERDFERAAGLMVEVKTDSLMSVEAVSQLKKWIQVRLQTEEVEVQNVVIE